MKATLRKGLMATAAGVMALGLGIGGAQAASVASQIFYNEINKLSDNSGESQAIDVNGDSLLGVGDTLRGTMDWSTLEDQTGGGGVRQLGTAGVNELSGIFEVEVVSRTIVGGITLGLGDADKSYSGPDGIIGTLDDTLIISGDELANYVFGPNLAFAAEFGLSAGAMIALFEDTTPDYDRTLATQAAIEATATDGALVWEWGFADADDLWNAYRAPVDPSFTATVPLGTALGSFNVQLSSLSSAYFLFNIQVTAGCTSPASPDFPCAGDGLVDLNGSGEILGTAGATSYYDAFDNVDVVFHPIPEPATLALLGFGLAGLGLYRRRRNG